MHSRGESPAIRTLTPPGAPALPSDVTLVSATFVAFIFEPPSIYARDNQDEKTGTAWDCGWRRSILGLVQAGDPGLKPDEQRRLRNRALARWLIAPGPAQPQPGSRPMSAELVRRDGRAWAAVTAADGQVLALYPVSGSGERRRLYQAVPVPVSQPLAPAPPPSVRADLAALRARSRESRTVSSAQAARSQALRQASVLLCARSRELCAVSSAQIRPRVALSRNFPEMRRGGSWPGMARR
jgi:hypothetical protein